MSISSHAYTRIPDYKDSLLEMKFLQPLNRLKSRGYSYRITIDESGVSTELTDPDGNPVTLQAAISAISLVEEREQAARRIRTAFSRLSAQGNLDRIRAKLEDPEWNPPSLDVIERMTSQEIEASPAVKAAFDNKIVWGNFLGPRAQRA